MDAVGPRRLRSKVLPGKQRRYASERDTSLRELIEVQLMLEGRQDIRLGMLVVSPEDLEAFSVTFWFPNAAVGKCNGVRDENPAQDGLLLRRRICFPRQGLLLARGQRLFPAPEMSLKRTM